MRAVSVESGLCTMPYGDRQGICQDCTEEGESWRWSMSWREEGLEGIQESREHNVQTHEAPQEHMFQGPERNYVWLEVRSRANRGDTLKTHRREARILVNNGILIVCIPVLICEDVCSMRLLKSCTWANVTMSVIQTLTLLLLSF